MTPEQEYQQFKELLDLSVQQHKQDHYKNINRMKLDLVVRGSEVNCLSSWIELMSNPVDNIPYTKEQLMRGLGYAYQMTEKPSFYKPLLKNYIPYLWEVRNRFMENKDYKTFRKLPKQFKVYRAGSSDGLSWTMDKGIADWFNERNHKLFGDTTSRVMEKVVDKKDVFAYLGSRNEKEIILLPKKMKKV